MSEEKTAIVLDNGSFTIRAGLSGEDSPKCELRNVIGRVKVPTGAKSEYVGDEAVSMRSLLQFEYPVQRGVIVNWDNMQIIWEHIFSSELQIEPESKPILVTEPLLEPTTNREKIAEVLLERFRFPALYVARRTAMSMYAAGRTTGLVLQSGDGVTEAMAMVEGFMVPESIQRFAIAGSDLTDYLASKLTLPSLEKDIVRQIKEALCYVPHKESRESGDKSYKLPDGQELQLTDSQRSSVMEAMFQPSDIGEDSEGVQKMVHSAIAKCDIDHRKELWRNVYLSGGNTLSPGFDNRLEEELRPLVPATVDVKVKAIANRQYAAWIGASIMSSLPTFEQMWVSKAEYEESGPSIVSRK